MGKESVCPINLPGTTNPHKLTWTDPHFPSYHSPIQSRILHDFRQTRIEENELQDKSQTSNNNHRVYSQVR